MKNNIIKYFWALTLMIFSVSCNKFLDTDLQDAIPVEKYYDTEEQLDFALAAVYSKLGDGTIYGGRITRMGIDADEGFYDRATDIIGVSVYNVYPTDPHVTAFWKTCYEGIYRANLLLANVNKPTIDISDANRAVIEGEALFLRGYYYFLLVSNFGGVPLITEPMYDTNNTAIPRNTAVEVYTQIVADMKKAEQSVKTIKQIGHGGRVSKSAVRGILARVYLHWAGLDSDQYGEAKFWANAVITDGDAGHKLNPDYRQVFINYSSDKYDIGESIWEVEFWGNTQSVYREAGQIGHFNGIQYNGGDNADPNHGFSYGFLNATGVLWEKYPDANKPNSSDIRRNWAIASFSLSGNPARETARALSWSGIYQRDCGKYRRFYEVVKPKENVYTPINYPLLRYSDVLLMFAEADVMASGYITDEAKIAVNKVRSRAYGKLLPGKFLQSINITKAGSGYASAPTLMLVGGDGTGAKLAHAAILSNKAVTDITITYEGDNNYTVAPQIIIGNVYSPNTSYAKDVQVSHNGRLYTVSTAGTSGVNGPTHASGVADNGTAKFTYAGEAATAEVVLNDNTIDSDIPATWLTSIGRFMDFIKDERSRELCFESLRKGDLVRWGKLVENMKIVRDHIEGSALTSTLDYVVWSYRNASTRDVLWPIPSYEMGLNSALIQNKGW